MKIQKSWSNLIYVLFIFLILFDGTYSEASNVYKNNLLYEGGKLIVTWRFQSDGMMASQYYWVDGKQTVNGVSCWRVFHSNEGYYVTDDEYGIGYYAMTDNEYRLYMQEYFQAGTSSKVIFTPYMLQWKYGVEVGETWSHDYTMSIESNSDFDYEDYLTKIFGEEYLSKLSEEEKQALIENMKPKDRQVSETYTLLEYEDITTYFGSYPSALKFEKQHIEDNEYESYVEYGWKGLGIGNIKAINKATNAETHYTYDYVAQNIEPLGLCQKVTHTSPSSTISDTALTFTWEEDEHSTYYRFWVGEPNGEKVFAKWYETAEICSGGNCSVTPELELTSGNYEWYIKSWNDNSKVWSDGMSFAVQGDDTPPSKATHTSPSGPLESSSSTFTWKEDSASTWYRLWVGYPGDIKVFGEWYEASEICSDGTCSVTTGTEFDVGNYEWYIKSWNDYGKIWSDGMSFSLGE